MKRKRFYLLLCAFLLIAGYTDCVGQKRVDASEGVPFIPVSNQDEGMRIIDALSKAYGDNPNVMGDFIIRFFGPEQPVRNNTAGVSETNDNAPGRYRFFYEVSLRHKEKKCKVCFSCYL